jgi:hypothetical protein
MSTKDNPVNVVPIYAGSGEGSNHFEFYVCDRFLHFCKRFPGLKPMTWSQGNNFTVASMSSSNEATNEISGNQFEDGNMTKLTTSGFTHIETMVRVWKESQIIGRENEKSDMIKLISNQSSEEVLVISVWGMGGLDKTTLIKEVYRS